MLLLLLNSPVPETVVATQGNAYFSTENLLASAAAVTIDNRDTSTPATNICDGKLGTVVRASAPGLPLIIKAALRGIVAVRGLLLAGLGDLPDGSTIRVCLSNVDADSQELHDQTVTVALPASRRQAMINLPTSIAAAFARIEITPSSGGFTVECGWAWIARADFEPAIGFQYDATMGFVPRSLSQVSKGSVEYHKRRRGLWQWTFTFQHLTAAEAMRTALEIDQDRDTVAPLLFVQHLRNTNTNLDQEALLGRFVQLDAVSMWMFAQHAKAYVLRECLAAEETVNWT